MAAKTDDFAAKFQKSATEFHKTAAEFYERAANFPTRTETILRFNGKTLRLHADDLEQIRYFCNKAQRVRRKIPIESQPFHLKQEGAVANESTTTGNVAQSSGGLFNL